MIMFSNLVLHYPVKTLPFKTTKVISFHSHFLQCGYDIPLNYLKSFVTVYWMKHKLESRLPGEISITSGDTTLMAESEELKRLLMKVKEESGKVGLKLNIQKTKIMASGPITSQQIDGETVQTVAGYFLGLQNHCRWWLQPWN